MHAGFGGKVNKLNYEQNRGHDRRRRKLLIIANEEGMDAWQKLLITTVMGAATNTKYQKTIVAHRQMG